MFHGERVGFSGKILQCFRDRTGKDHNFTGIKWVYFGCVYPMVGDSMKRKPEEIEVEDWKPTENDRNEFEAQKLVVRAKRQAMKKAMDLKKPHDDITRAVGLIRRFYVGLDNLDRRRFMDWFANECSKKGKK